jgi:hypothetical protein
MELEMKRLALAFILLSFCATWSVAGPAPQSNGQTTGEINCSHGFKECKESLNDFKEAERFMRLKATVLADVNRLEKWIPANPKIATVRNADVMRQKTGHAAVYHAMVGPNRMASGQASSVVRPVSLGSAAGTPKEKR